MNSKDAEGEYEEMGSMDTRISNLEKNQADIMTLLRSLNERINPVIESPLESVRKRVQFQTDESAEPVLHRP